MTADTPPRHDIGTAVIAYRGHVSKPKRLRGLTVTSGWQDGVIEAAPARCRVEHSKLTLAARTMGVQSMTTYWCAA